MSSLLTQVSGGIEFKGQKVGQILDARINTLWRNNNEHRVCDSDGEGGWLRKGEQGLVFNLLDFVFCRFMHIQWNFMEIHRKKKSFHMRCSIFCTHRRSHYSG